MSKWWWYVRLKVVFTQLHSDSHSCYRSKDVSCKHGYFTDQQKFESKKKWLIIVRRLNLLMECDNWYRIRIIKKKPYAWKLVQKRRGARGMLSVLGLSTAAVHNAATKWAPDPLHLLKTIAYCTKNYLTFYPLLCCKFWSFYHRQNTLLFLYFV